MKGSERMENWKKSMEIFCDSEDHTTQIASHRGNFTAGILENTTLAFLCAIGQGADMVEMDLTLTKDGRIVGHHDETMFRLFRKPGRISDYTLEELMQMELFNYLGEPCADTLETFDEILKALRDKTILVLDKCWDCWDAVYELLKGERLVNQAVFKFYPEDEKAFAWAAAHADCIFVPMLRDTGYLDEIFRLKQQASLPALEILPEKESDLIFQKEVIEHIHKKRIKIWCNSLSLSRNSVFGAGFDDLKSLRFGGDEGWGRLISQGTDIIQTDFPYELRRYLNRK